MKGPKTSLDVQYIQYHIDRNLTKHCFTHARPPCTPSSPKPRTGLSRLPNELLFQIFSYLLKSSTPIIITDFQKQDISTTTSSYINFTNRLVNHYIGASSGLFLADRKISDAALTVLYSNKFILKLRVNFTRSFLLSIGPKNRNRMRLLQFGAYSQIKSSSWQHNLKREFYKLGEDVREMTGLRAVEYMLEWTHGRDYPLGGGKVDDAIQVERRDLGSWHGRLLGVWEEGVKHVRVDVISSAPSPDLPKVSQQSRLLNLPDDVIRRILSFCHKQKEVLLSSPHNYFTLNRTLSIHPLDVVLKHHSPCFDYFSLFLVCKKIGAMMREIVYEKTRFKVRDRGWAILSSVLADQDFERIRELELVLGYPNQERMVYIVLCLKGVIWRLLREGSGVKKVTMKVDRLSVPYMATAIPLLRELGKKCQLEIFETLGTGNVLNTGESFGIDPGKENDIRWMLDGDGAPIWTWSWAANGWKYFDTVIRRELGERDRVGKVNGMKEKKKKKEKGKDVQKESLSEQGKGEERDEVRGMQDTLGLPVPRHHSSLRRKSLQDMKDKGLGTRILLANFLGALRLNSLTVLDSP